VRASRNEDQDRRSGRQTRVRKKKQEIPRAEKEIVRQLETRNSQRRYHKIYIRGGSRKELHDIE
jgi:hypothetical protein